MDINAKTDNKLINMNFKDADLKDVLRSIAELADVNLVVDSSVTGKITVQLNDITFNQALSKITMIKQLQYRWDKNTIVVATPERIQEVYGKKVTEIVNIQYSDINKISELINGLLSDVNVQINKEKDLLILHGEESQVKEAISFVKKIDKKVDRTTEVIRITDGSINEIKNNLTGIYPQLIIKINEHNESLIISGKEKIVKQALTLMEELGTAAEDIEKKTEVVKVKNGNIKSIEKNITGIYPELIVKINERNQKLIINGNDNQVNSALDLISQLDTAINTDMQNVEIKYSDIAKVQTHVESVFPQVEIKKDSVNDLLIISGKSKYVNQALTLAKKMDQKNESIHENGS